MADGPRQGRGRSGQGRRGSAQEVHQEGRPEEEVCQAEMGRAVWPDGGEEGEETEEEGGQHRRQEEGRESRQDEEGGQAGKDGAGIQMKKREITFWNVCARSGYMIA